MIMKQGLVFWKVIVYILYYIQLISIQHIRYVQQANNPRVICIHGSIMCQGRHTLDKWATASIVFFWCKTKINRNGWQKWRKLCYLKNKTSRSSKPVERSSILWLKPTILQTSLHSLFFIGSYKPKLIVFHPQ